VNYILSVIAVYTAHSDLQIAVKQRCRDIVCTVRVIKLQSDRCR